MSSTTDASELKGGRPPAVKVGGMRVVQHKRVTSESEKAEEEKMSEEMAKEEDESENTELEEKDPSTDAVAAATYHKSDKDFPKDAINAFHVKPLPTKDVHNHQKPQHQHIQQPRKD